MLTLWLMVCFRLRPLDPFLYATYQLGDTSYYTIQPDDKIEAIPVTEAAHVPQLIAKIFARSSGVNNPEVNLAFTNAIVFRYKLYTYLSTLHKCMPLANNSTQLEIFNQPAIVPLDGH